MSMIDSNKLQMLKKRKFSRTAKIILIREFYQQAIEVEIEGETTRVHGGYKYLDGLYFSSESIVDYTLDGKVIGEEYRQDYDEDDCISSASSLLGRTSHLRSHIRLSDRQRPLTTAHGI